MYSRVTESKQAREKEEAEGERRVRSGRRMLRVGVGAIVMEDAVWLWMGGDWSDKGHEDYVFGQKINR